VGTGEDNAVLLPVGPERAGILVYTPDAGDPFTVQFRPAAGLRATVQAGDEEEVPLDGPVAMVPSPPGPATEIHVDRARFWVLARAMGKAAVRIQDPESELLATFQGIDTYPIDPAWRIVGRYEAFPEPREMLIPNQLGHTDTTEAYGRVVFTVDGVEHDLIPTQDDAEDGNLFFVFADETNGAETYGAGRFLYTPIREDGTVVLDFNRAYNPPCAYNPWTTCPLPPEGNTLPIAVTAGEQKYAGESAPTPEPSR
jgi:uncharacterized protein (DUF1684 family)